MDKKMIIPLFIMLAIISGIIAYGITYYQVMSKSDGNILLNNEKDPSFIDDVLESEEKEEATVRFSNNEEVMQADTVGIIKVTPSTRMVYQEYYSVDDTVKVIEEEPPYHLLEMTKDEVAKFYNDWEMIYFSEEKVVLRRSVEAKNPTGYYIVKEKEGNIAIYYDYSADLEKAFNKALASGLYTQNEYEKFINIFLIENEDIYLREVLEISLLLLNKHEQERLKNGIQIYGDEELIQLLENYTS